MERYRKKQRYRCSLRFYKILCQIFPQVSMLQLYFGFSSVEGIIAETSSEIIINRFN